MSGTTERHAPGALGHVTLNGVALDTSAPLTWTLVPGTAPHVVRIELPAATAEELVSIARPFGAVLKLGDLEVNALTVLGISAGSHRDTRFLRVADCRWAWSRKHVFRHLNVRQRTGNKTRVGNLDAPLAAAQFADDEVYRPWSIENGTRAWTVHAALSSVLDEVTNRKWRDGVAADFEFANVILEELLLDDPGDTALTRLLSVLGGGLDLWVDLDGTTVLKPRLDDAERDLVGLSRDQSGTIERGKGPAIGPQIFGEPLWAMQSRRLERPTLYRVLFDREVELRFDFKEATDGRDSQIARDRPPLTLRNVLPVPDASLALAANAGGDTVLQGTWVTVTDYLAAKAGSWGRTPTNVGDAGNLTPLMVRACYMSSGCAVFLFYDDTDVTARAVNEVLAGYRASYQIDHRWLKRLAWWRPSLVSVVDPKRGTLAASPVYQNYAEWLTSRAAPQEVEGSKELALFVRNRYARADKGSVIAGTIGGMGVAPARVVVLDQDAGVFAVRFGTDATGQQYQVIPSALEPETLPSTDPTATVTSLAQGRLSTDHEVSVVLTVGVGAPNDGRALHAIEVDPRDVASRLGRKDVGECAGPPIELRVNAAHGIAARFAWKDDQSLAIRNAFEETAGSNLLGAALPVALNLNQDDLIEYAKAAAAAHLAGFLDHPEGTYATWFAPGAKPAGTAAIEHRLAAGPGGGAITSVLLPPDPPRVDLMPYLSDSVRKRVLRQLP